MSPTTADPRGRMRHALAPLRHRSFALIWLGLAVSVLGDGIYIVALAAGFAPLANGPVLLATAGGAFFLPQLFLALPAGAAADRWSRPRVVVVTSAVKAAAVAVLAVAVTQDAASVAVVAGTSLVLGAAEAFASPALSALVPDVVPHEMVPQAVALRGFVDTVGVRLLGPVVGGVLVAATSLSIALIVDVASFLVLAALVAAARPVHGIGGEVSEAVERTSLLVDLRAGLRFAWHEVWLRSMLVTSGICILATFGMVQVVVPLLVSDLTGGSSTSIGVALAAAGVGGVMGSVTASLMGAPSRPMALAFACWGLAGACVALLGFSNELWHVMVLLVLEGWFAIIGFVLAVGVMMQRTPRLMRGRVASVDDFASNALVPLSFVVAGTLAASWSIKGALVAGGLVEVAVVALALALVGTSVDRVPAAIPDVVDA